MTQPDPKPEPLFLYGVPTPVAYACPRCGALVPILEEESLLAHNQRDPWDVHQEWHARVG